MRKPYLKYSVHCKTVNLKETPIYIVKHGIDFLNYQKTNNIINFIALNLIVELY